MEKKTIGKFIAVLRKANGMTQKDLADKLFVSDKTVSRWERDECDPDLSLIPAIAELFGITTDELLRGERNSLEATITEEPKPSTKSDKQFKTMLRARVRKYKNLSLISVGLLLAGLIAAVVCGIVFYKTMLGFWVSLLFVVASTICQISLTSNSIILSDEYDESYAEKIIQANSKITKVAIAFFYGMTATFIFCLLIAFSDVDVLYLTNGFDIEVLCLQPNEWMLLSLLFFPATFAVFGLIHLLFVKPILIKRGLIFVTVEKCRKITFRRRILVKITAVGGFILSVLLVAGIVIGLIGVDGFVKKEVYNTLEEFGKAMKEDQAEYIEWHRNTHYYDKDGNKIYMNPDIEDDWMLKHDTVTDPLGNVIFEYDYNSTLYKSIKFSGSGTRTPVTVITNHAYWDAQYLGENILSWLILFACIDIFTCATVYFIKAYGKKSKKI
jgi:transcriptional regulator with XRE-family HTH domain